MSVVQRRIFAIFVTVFAAVLVAAGWPFGASVCASSPSPSDSLLILHTNDIHAHLLPFVDSKGNTVGGAAARATLIAKLRERSRMDRTLLLDAGDVFQGTPMYNFFRGVPDYRVMSRVGYDAGAFGNHELDDGPAAWLRVRREATFPLVTANVFVSADSGWAASLADAVGPVRRGARWVGGEKVKEGARLRFITKPYVILDVRGVKVGVLGLTTKDIVSIVDRARNGGVAVVDPVTAAEVFVPEIRRRADVVVALTHLGVDEDRRLAARVPGIDIIVGGHSHTFLWEPLFVRNGNANGYRGTGIVQAGRWGDRVGRLAVGLRSAGGLGRRGVQGMIDALIPVRPSDGEDPAVAAMLAVYRDSMSILMDKPVFVTPERVPMAGLEDGDTPLGNFVADAMLESSRADLAVINTGGIRAPLPQGKVTVGDVYTVLPFDNMIVKVPMKGWQVRELFDFIAGRVGRRGFAQIAGASFVIRRNRASDIRIGGKSLDSDHTYQVATLDFLYGGGDGYTLFSRAGEALPTGVYTRDAAVDFLKRRPSYEFRKQGRIRWEGGMPTRDLLSPR